MKMNNWFKDKDDWQVEYGTGFIKIETFYPTEKFTVYLSGFRKLTKQKILDITRQIKLVYIAGCNAQNQKIRDTLGIHEHVWI